MIAPPLTQGTQEESIIGTSGLPGFGDPGLTKRESRAQLEELSCASQFKRPGKGWFIPIMSCF